MELWDPRILWRREADLRRMLRDEEQRMQAVRYMKFFWVEPGLGSTVGLPDLYIGFGEGKAIWCELKCGEFRNGRLSWNYTQNQPRIMESFLNELKVPVLLLVAEKNGRRLLFLDPKHEAINYWHTTDTHSGLLLNAGKLENPWGFGFDWFYRRKFE